MYYPRLRNLREDNDKTQSQIAELLGISRQHYSLYKKGLRQLPMNLFIVLAKYYNVSLDYPAGLTNTIDSWNRNKQPPTVKCRWLFYLLFY